MVRKNTLRMVLVCAILFLWIAVPTAFNIRYSIIISNTMFRFNIWVSAIICMILLLSNIRKIRLDRYEIIYLTFIFFSAINTFIHVGISGKCLSSGVDGLLTLILPYILTKTVMMMESDLIDKIFVFIKILTVYLLIQVYETNTIAALRGWTDISDRASTTFGESNTTAGFLVAVALMLLISYIKFNRKLDIILFALTVIAILMSQTRTAIGLLIIFIGVVFFVYGDKKKHKLFIYLFIGAVGIYFLYPEIYMDIYYRFFTSQSSGSNQLRKVLREIGLLEFYKRPIFGAGNGLLIYRISRVNRYVTDIGNTHNQWVAILDESGIIGLLIFILFLFSFVTRHITHTRETKVVCICFLLFIILGFWFEIFFTSEIRATMCFWIYPLIIKYFEQDREIIHES